MVSIFTANIQLEEPARGDDVGTWDTPVNSNMTLVDLVVGGIATIPLNNTPVVLSAAQFQARQITFNSTLTGSCAITFPSTFTKDYDIQNLCTGSSAFVITLGTTAAAGQAICVPFGETVECFNDGTNIKFKNLGRVGGYWDYAGSSVPAWVTGCTVPPYLNCSAGAFSSATYPVLAVILNGTTLPDRRGTAGYALNQGTGRLTTVNGGLDGNTIFATKVTDTVTIGTSNLPAYTPAGAITNGAISFPAAAFASDSAGGDAAITLGPLTGGANLTTILNPSQALSSFAGTPQGGVSDGLPAIGTGTVYGITMIRAA